MVLNSDVFKKVKAKVGKRAPGKANDTNTEFAAAGLHVVQQEVLYVQASASTTERGLTWDQLANQLQHPAAAVRRSAVVGFGNLHKRKRNSTTDVLKFITTVGPAAVADSNSQVRTEGFALLKQVVEELDDSSNVVRPFLGMLVSLVNSSLNSLDTKQTHHGAIVVKWMAESGIIGTKDEAASQQLLVSLARLLIRPHGKDAIVGQTKGKPKKRKRQQKKSSDAAPESTVSSQSDVLCSVDALLQATSSDSTVSPQGDTTHSSTAPIVPLDNYFSGNRRTKKPRLLRSIRDLCTLPDTHVTPTTVESGQSLHNNVCSKLRDLLFEAEPGDDQYMKCASCLRNMAHLRREKTHCPIFASIVRYLTTNNHHGADGMILVTIWKLSRDLTDADKWSQWVIKEAIQELQEADFDETILDVVELVFFNSTSVPQDLVATFAKRCFQASAPPMDWTLPCNRRIAKLGCRLLRETESTREVTEIIVDQFSNMLVSWKADYPLETKDCLCVLHLKATNSDLAGDWAESLEPLFDNHVFRQFEESIQRQLICLVSKLMSPSAGMVHHWSSLIANDHPLGDWMAQCMHKMRKTIPMATYLGFIIDSMGIMEGAGLQTTNLRASFDQRIRRAGWALLNCGNAKSVLAKVQRVLVMMLEKQGPAARAAMSFIAMFSLDLKLRNQPSSVEDLGLSCSFQAALTESIYVLDSSKEDENWVRPASVLLALYPSLQKDVSDETN